MKKFFCASVLFLSLSMANSTKAMEYCAPLIGAAAVAATPTAVAMLSYVMHAKGAIPEKILKQATPWIARGAFLGAVAGLASPVLVCTNFLPVECSGVTMAYSFGASVVAVSAENVLQFCYAMRNIK